MNYYMKYWNTKINRQDWVSRMVGPKPQHVPGYSGDPDPRKKFKHKFDRWYGRSNMAKRIYWRTHPLYHRKTQ